MTRHEAPLDPELAAWLKDPRVALRAPLPEALASFRTAANGYLSRDQGPDVFAVEDFEVAGVGGPVRMRMYRPASEASGSAVVFLHGGGFVFGDLETHDALCRRLALATGVDVYAADYRLAPEHPFPAGLIDCQTAVRAVRTIVRSGKIALVGDSAGAQLAIATALAFGEAGAPVNGLGLLYPLIDPSRGSPSQATFGEGHMLTGDFLDWAWLVYRGSKDAGGDPWFDLTLADLSPLPPTLVVTAGHDPLRDEGLAFVDRAAAGGATITAWHYPDMIHGFLGLPGGSRRAEEALARLAEGLKTALG